jgi:hypothetical protein
MLWSRNFCTMPKPPNEFQGFRLTGTVSYERITDMLAQVVARSCLPRTTDEEAAVREDEAGVRHDAPDR